MKIFRILIFTLLLLTAFLNGQKLMAQVAEKIESSEMIFQQANSLLEKSNRYQQQSRENILSANTIRKEVNQLRADSRKQKDEKISLQLSSYADQLTQQLAQQQQQGAKLRADSLSLKMQSVALFQKGLMVNFEPWIENQSPLTMDQKTLDYISHNARIRSVHPSMLNKMGSASENQPTVNSDKIDMTLQVPALVAQNAPPDLNIEAFQLSHKQNFFAHIEVQNKNKGEYHNVSQVPLNRMHQWRLIISDKNGLALENAEIEVLGHMPGHVHGLPTQPRVTAQIDKGVYLVEGMKFQMRGWWVIEFKVEIKTRPDRLSKQQQPEQPQTDSLTFNLIL